MAQGTYVAESPSDRLKPEGPPGGSRYQYWNFQVEPASMLLPGTVAKSRARALSPLASATCAGAMRNTPPPTQKAPGGGVFNMRARAKYNAWLKASAGEPSKAEAMRGYAQAVDKADPGWRQEAGAPIDPAPKGKFGKKGKKATTGKKKGKKKTEDDLSLIHI